VRLTTRLARARVRPKTRAQVRPSCACAREPKNACAREAQTDEPLLGISCASPATASRANLLEWTFQRDVADGDKKADLSSLDSS